MTGIVPDTNIEGLIVSLVGRLRRSEYGPFWEAARLDLQTFSDLGWPTDLADREVWTRCQAMGLVLVTDNRNQDDPDSLEATLRDSARPDSLPIVTVADKQRLRGDREYADRVAVDLLELLIDIKERGLYLGAGRVFLPLPRNP